MMGQYHEDENAWDYLHVEDDGSIYLGRRIFSCQLSQNKLHATFMEECDRVFEAMLTKREMGALIGAMQNLYDRMEE